MVQFLGKKILVTMLAASAISLAASQANARTYIVNGLASAVPFIGYGMNNLGKKIPGSKVFSYIDISVIQMNQLI